jgi:hypothetical protein
MTQPPGVRHALGFVGGVGDLAKLVMAVDGRREIADARSLLGHEPLRWNGGAAGWWLPHHLTVTTLWVLRDLDQL